MRVLTYVARTGTAGRALAKGMPRHRIRDKNDSHADDSPTIKRVILIPHFLCPRPSAAAEPIGSLRTSDVIEIAHSASNKCTGRRGRRFGCGLAHRKSRKPRRALPETGRGSHCRLHIGVLRARSLARHPLANGQCTPAVLARFAPSRGKIDIGRAAQSIRKRGHVPEEAKLKAIFARALDSLIQGA